jgi:hypothetical protein
MTTKRTTKRTHFTNLLKLSEVQANPELVEFINHELELLTKKNATEKKPTATQVANEATKEAILDALTENGGLMSITDIQKSSAELGELSNQKISALLRQLILESKVTKVEDKRKVYFKAV